MTNITSTRHPQRQSERRGVQSSEASPPPDGSIVAVCRSCEHGFSKYPQTCVRLLAGIGVEGDAHSGETVKHRSRVAVNPEQPNLRQVHLLDFELLEKLNTKGFDLQPGSLGENITTAGIDLLSLPAHTRLLIGEEVELETTGLRNPCRQIDEYRPGLLTEVAPIDDHGGIVRKCGIMATVIAGGLIGPGDPIALRLPPLPHLPLRRV